MQFQFLTILISSIIIGVAILLLGIFVYSANKKDLINKIFFFLTVGVFVWILTIAVRFSGIADDLTLLSTRMSYTAIVVVVFLFTYFSYIFPIKNKYKFPFLIASLTTISMIILSLFTSYIIQDVISTSSEQINIFGPYFYVFGVYFILYVGWGMFNLISKRSHLDITGIAQINFMIVGTIFSAIFGFSSNFIVPTIAQTTTTEKYGPFAMIFLVLFTAYAILKHHLFNIKVIATEILTFTIWGFILTRTLVSNSLRDIFINGVFFIFVIVFGILLIRSVRKEVEQREKLEVLTKELEDKNIKLQELDKVRSEFLSFASHQVKAPMTVVKGFASMIYDGTLGEVSEKIKEVAQKIQISAERLIALVNNLLDLRRIEEGKMELNFGKTDLNELIASLTEEFKLLAENKKIELIYKPISEKIFINADLQKFRQVIQNLIENAIKYTEKGWVEVAVEKQGGESVLISISDSGRGISKELLPNLFKQFSRDRELAKELQGTGLGLYIAKQIIDGHKGQIWAESPGQNKGSVFYVKMPVV